LLGFPIEKVVKIKYQVSEDTASARQKNCSVSLRKQELEITPQVGKVYFNLLNKLKEGVCMEVLLLLLINHLMVGLSKVL
jgi:hypothetical protein